MPTPFYEGKRFQPINEAAIKLRRFVLFDNDVDGDRCYARSLGHKDLKMSYYSNDDFVELTNNNKSVIKIKSVEYLDLFLNFFLA
jgi:hypothetical protein